MNKRPKRSGDLFTGVVTHMYPRAMSRTLGVLGKTKVLLTEDGAVLQVQETAKGREVKRLGIPAPGLFDGVTRRGCEGTLYGSCSNSGLVDPSSEQRRFLGQAFLITGPFTWHGAGTIACCFSCAHPPR